MMRIFLRIGMSAVALLLLVASGTLAYAFDEPNGYSHSQDCQSCHRNVAFADYFKGTGPHGGYTATTSRCEVCHSVHSAPAGSVLLLPEATIKATCETCHDGTAGFGVYGAIAAGLGTPAAQHRIDATRTVPGGDAVTGGSAVTSFTGESDTLTCDDCHSPHGSQVVGAFRGERQRTEATWWTMGLRSTRLLKQRPTSAVTTVTEYGSDWCLACHKGRASGGAVHNHPVDSLAVTTTPFIYARVALIEGYAPTGLTTIGPMVSGSASPFVKVDDGNRGFLMPYPRTEEQAGHAPLCQQCHEDARFVGTLSEDGLTADVATFSITMEDGDNATDTPRYQNFPHESTNPRFLVETDDDLCTNCHPPAVLP